MPIRQRIWAGMLFSWALLGATACDDDKEQAAKLAEVQRIADEKLKKAQADATDKVAGMQSRSTQMKADAENRRGQVQERIRPGHRQSPRRRPKRQVKLPKKRSRKRARPNKLEGVERSLEP